jgi:hypothetical protein
MLTISQFFRQTNYSLDDAIQRAMTTKIEICKKIIFDSPF